MPGEFYFVKRFASNDDSEDIILIKWQTLDDISQIVKSSCNVEIEFEVDSESELIKHQNLYICLDAYMIELEYTKIKLIMAESIQALELAVKKRFQRTWFS